MAGRRAFDGWSRAVGWLKVVLPLTALGLLSTLFLVSNRIDPETAIPYSDVDVESLVREPRLTKPVYSGTTSNGSTLTLQALEARPATTPGNPSTAVDVTATLTSRTGLRTDIRSDTASLDAVTNTLRLTGNVQIDSSAAYKVRTEALDADLSASIFTSSVPVQATGPAGTVTADSMSLMPDPKGEGTYLLVFNGRVKLVYQPK